MQSTEKLAKVIDAAEQVPGYEVQETRASKSGLVYESATGEEISYLGEVFMPMMTKENTVVFDEDSSFIFNEMTGEINQPREESGNYMFDVWIPPESTTIFHRQ